MFLSLGCLLGGAVILILNYRDRLAVFDAIAPILEKTQPILGIYCLIIGIFRFIYPFVFASNVYGDPRVPAGANWPIVGDFFPAVVCISIGLLFFNRLFDYIHLSSDQTKALKRKEVILTQLSRLQVFLAYIAVGLGILHFFIASMPLL